MAMIPLNLAPGLFSNATPYETGARWRNGNLVRWVNGELRPIGGWVSLAADLGPTGVDMQEPVRNMLSWRDNSSGVWLGLGSADKLAVMDQVTETAYDITPPTLSWNPGGRTGYGSGDYGRGRYGTSRPTAVQVDQDAFWSLDTWGEDLVGVHTQDGRLFRWDTSGGTGPGNEAAAVPTAPIDNYGVVVTEERHVMLLGAGGNPRQISWCSQEDINDWTPSPTNSAGGFELQTTGRICCGVRVPGGVLVLTTSDAHLVSYVGGDFIYGRERIGDNAGVVSPLAAVSVPGGAVWMHDNEFYAYDGVVHSFPCDIYDEAFTSSDLTRPVTVHAGWNESHEEVWFFLRNSSAEPNRALVWSLRQGSPYWTIADIERTAFARSAGGELPFAVSPDNTVYVHEAGFLDDGSPRSGIYAETGAMEIGQGDQVVRCRKVFQDAIDPLVEATYPYTLTFKLRQAPGAEERTAGPYTMNAERGYTDVRFRARQARMRLDSVEDLPWTLGKLRIEAVAGGRR